VLFQLSRVALLILFELLLISIKRNYHPSCSQFRLYWKLFNIDRSSIVYPDCFNATRFHGPDSGWVANWLITCSLSLFHVPRPYALDGNCLFSLIFHYFIVFVPLATSCSNCLLFACHYFNVCFCFSFPSSNSYGIFFIFWLYIASSYLSVESLFWTYRSFFSSRSVLQMNCNLQISIILDEFVPKILFLKASFFHFPQSHLGRSHDSLIYVLKRWTNKLIPGIILLFSYIKLTRFLF
jgi:hypothetical protein